MSRFTTSLTAAVVAAGFLALGATAWAQGPWQAPASEKGQTSPGGSAANGKKLADTTCVACHGPGGKGDGAAAAALNPKPADWTSAKVQRESDGELFWKISNGRGPMPPWKHLSEKDRWDLLAHVRSLKK
jgi:mono/diheme cytochrome c family protein